MKNFLIDGIWQGPPSGVSTTDWLNEVIAYSGFDFNLQSTGVVRRIQKVKRIRKTGRGRGVAVNNLKKKKR
jgi:hypothetical protein